MAPMKFTSEINSSVPAKRLFSAIIDSDNLLPKLMPNAVKGVQSEGDGGPGTIKTVTYEIDGKAKQVKNRVEAVDKEKMMYSYTVMRGEGENIESATIEMKLEATADGGTKVTNVSTYNIKAGVEVKPEEIEKVRAKALSLFKLLEAYLVANPDAYA